MKNFHFLTLLAVGVFLAAAIATYQPATHTSGGSYSFASGYSVAPVTGGLCPDVTRPAIIPTPKSVGDTSLSVSLTPAFSYTIGKVRLMGDEGTRPFPAELSVTELTAATLPPLDQGMVNVTDYAAGYRMLPDGMVFNGDISIVLPYDSTLLPAGFTPDDIVTYYYDVRSGRWTAIGRDSVSTADALVYSKVNHFTDFINAVIKTPEMPETSAFTPTSIKELEAANPLEGLQLIQAPTANNSGTANLSYQLEIPAGRQGMQPNLALTYSSSGGNGWLGVGWDISVPSITVETRWGVPRYESNWESEVYLYGGEQLLMIDSVGHTCKMPHRTNQQGQTSRTWGTKHFVTRAGEAHDSIVRHGNAPQDYWWEVVDRNGVTSYYGAYPPGDTTHGPTRIGGPDGIARWALAATVDPNGNMVRYYYSIDYNAGAGGEAGKQLYLDSINYTGYYSRIDSTAVPGAYTVVFHRNDGREDVTTNARYGFKEVTASTLCNAQVMFNDELVRTFFFVTDNSRSSNYKTRLEHLIRADGTTSFNEILSVTGQNPCISANIYAHVAGKVPIVHYDFEYFNYPEAENMFSEPVQQNLNGEGVSSSFLNTSCNGTALGATEGKSWGLGGTATIGFGPDVATTLASGGANFSYNRSKNTGLLALIDLDGDGLADKVYKKNKKVYYRPQIRLSETMFEFGQEIELLGIKDFLLETGNNFDIGLQLSVVVFAASGNFPVTTSTTTNYFTDINGDGRPDLVTKNGAYFNCLNQDGSIHFSPANSLAAPAEPGEESYSAFVFSDNHCDTFYWDGAVDPSLECGDVTEWGTHEYNLKHGCNNSNYWGYVIKHAGDTSFTISNCTYYHFGNEDSIHCYCPTTGWKKISLCSWVPWEEYESDLLHNDTVQVGDCYYHISSSGGEVIEIYPQSVPYCGPIVGRDPDIDAVRVWIAPMDGDVKVTSRIRLLPDTSESCQQARYMDGVAYAVQHSRGIAWEHGFLENTLNPFHYHAGISSESDNIIISGDIGVADTNIHSDSVIITGIRQGDMFFFDLNSKDNHSFDKVEWKQEITYQNMDSLPDAYGVDKRHYDSESDFILTGDSYFRAPMSGDVTISGTIYADNLTRPAQIHIKKEVADVTVADSVISILADTILPYSLEGASSITWHVDSGTIIRVYAAPDSLGLRPNWSALTFNPVLNFASTFSGVNDTLEYHLPLHYDIDSSQVFSILPDNILSHHKHRAYQIYHSLFGSLYRGWGYFGYNNNTFRFPTHAIRLNRLVLPRTMINPPGSSGSDTIFTDANFDYNDIDTNRLTEEAYMNSLFESQNLYNPLSDSTSWVQVTPYPEYGAYMSFGDVAYFSRSVMANTRMIDLAFRGGGDEGEEDWDIPEYESAIPISTDGFPVRVIRKQNISAAGTGSFGATVPCGDNDNSNSGSGSGNGQGGFSLSTSFTTGHNRLTADCMDLNGDGFPDFITDKKVQYTMPWGGIGAATYSLDEEICYTQTNSRGSNFGASCLTPERETKLKSKNNVVMFAGSGSASANLGDGNDNTTISYMDINGDGLPDMVRADGNTRLNLGYRFSGHENWNNNFIRNGSSTTRGSSVSIGGEWSADMGDVIPEDFNFAQASISGGIGNTHSLSNTEQMLVDVNGDGLPDKVSMQGSSMYVWYNYGNGFTEDSDNFSAEIGRSAFFSESLNLGVTAGFTFLGAWKLTFGVQVTPFSRSFSRDHTQLVDINGDGYADLVSSGSENTMSVRYNQAGKTNLLRKVTNFCGAYTEMDYTLSVPCYEQPQRQWNLQTVATGEETSGFPTSQLTKLDSIEYRNPHYNRYERLPYGYDTVIVRQYNTEDDNSLYRFTVQGFNNRSFFKRGWKDSESVCDADGKMWIEKLYHATLLDWEHPSDTIGDDDCATLVFSSYETELTRYYEGDTIPHIVTEIMRRYDSLHNVILYVNKGDTSHTDEYFAANISYKSGFGRNQISFPDTIVVRDKQNQILQKRVALYDSLGNLAAIEQFCGDSVSRYDFYHNLFGGVDSLRLPRNYRGQRMGYAYEYDTIVHSFPVRTRDVFGYSSFTTYDYRFGKPLTTTDLNGNTMRFHYDEWGRLDTLVGPNELASNKSYTISMEYHPYLSSGGSSYVASPASCAITSHYDMQHSQSQQTPDNPIQTILYCDGTGRVIQTKKDAEIYGTEQHIVSGKVEYDCFGRTIAQYHPEVDPLNELHYHTGFTPSTLTATTYDILDRPLKVILPTLDSAKTEYGFGTDTESGKTYFRTTTTDPKGISVTTLTGTRKQQIKTIAPHGAVTTFTYDALGQLLSSSDPFQHATTYTYDMLGRMVQRVHPDAGTDTYTYDGAGNVLKHATQVLTDSNKTIDYHYTYNRLDSIVYPYNSLNNVRYTYGDSTATHNQRGRIALLEDASGFRAYKYGRMGEVTEEHRTFVLPKESSQYSFKTQFEYDSWNRVQNITYPDGEVVRYYYNTGGMLRRIRGEKSYLNTVVIDTFIIVPPGPIFPKDTPDESTADNDTSGNGDRGLYQYYYYNYVDDILYNRFELKAGQLYGNGTHSHYSYDVLHRLDTLKLYDANGNALQDIKYNYDAVGNICSIQNNASIVNALGGRYTYTYEYDSLYRLTEGIVTVYAPRKTLHDTVRMTYYADGRIASKYQKGSRYVVNGPNFNQNVTYTYHTSQPHTADEVGGRNYTWDANGNMLSEVYFDPRNTRIYSMLEWNEENRLQKADMPEASKCAYYLYDADGERFYKNAGSRTLMYQNGQPNVYREYDDPVLYVSPYVVATPEGYTKHYFAESERVASHIGEGSFTNITTHSVSDSLLISRQSLTNKVAPDSILPNKFSYLLNSQSNWSAYHTTYWQHADHLGSASWITDTNGVGYQQLMYMPWGEPLLDRHRSNTSYDARYTFSGKERDEETGYSYFGARYYHPTLSIWLSVDPMADKYPCLSPYVYCANNPVKLVDQDGEDFGIPPFCQAAAKKVVATIRDYAIINNNKYNSNSGWVIHGQYRTTNEGKKTDTKSSSADKYNMYVNYDKVFYVDESDANSYVNYEAYMVAYMMASFVAGTGPENYDFPENGVISSAMLGSSVVRQAVERFNAGNLQPQQYTFNPVDLLNNFYNNKFNFFNIEGMVGSAFVTVTPAENDMLSITIFNITSLTSGAYFKDIYKNITGGSESFFPDSIMRNPNQKTPYGNISQTFHLLIPKDFFSFE